MSFRVDGRVADAGRALVERAAFMEELKRYVRFDDADLERLRAFHERAAQHFEHISNEFYERTREFEGAHAVFTGEEQIARLQRSMVRWLHRLCTQARDDDYFRESAKIGQAHVRVGLPQRYVFTAMALVRVALDRIADAEMGERAPLVRESLAKAIDIELAVMIETYCDDFIGRIRRIERLEREDLGRALARTEHRYVHAVEAAPYLVIGTNANGEIILFNREAERVSGYERDEVLGRKFLDVMVADGERDDLVAKVRAEIERAGGGASFDALIVTKSNHHRKVRWHLVHAENEHQDEAVAIAFGRDVTDEDAREVRARQIEKLAAVGTLAAGLAHEIRNPLNGAQLHVTYLERGLRKNGEPEALEAVRVVGSEIQRLSTLVNEFLDFARPKPLDSRRVVVQQLCERAVQLVSADASRAHVDLVTQLPETELVAEIDPARMEQVLLNLLHNAIEVLAPGQRGTVTLRVRRQPLNFTLEVEDDGPGLPGPNAPVFDAFYTTKPTGTGLGLAIVHRIVTDHGGSITVDSRPGRTVFRATIPIAQNRETHP